MRLRGRTDLNQKAVVDALREAGATVWVTSGMGKGAPDLVVGYGCCNFLLEVKSLTGALTEEEAKWHSDWQGKVYVVRTPLHALKMCGIK